MRKHLSSNLTASHQNCRLNLKPTERTAMAAELWALGALIATFASCSMRKRFDMQFSIGRFRIEIFVTDRRKPWDMGRIARRRLANEIWAIAVFQWGEYRGNHKINRVRALRQIARDRGWDGFTLRDAKEWVESAYAQNGSGAVL